MSTEHKGSEPEKLHVYLVELEAKLVLNQKRRESLEKHQKKVDPCFSTFRILNSAADML